MLDMARKESNQLRLGMDVQGEGFRTERREGSRASPQRDQSCVSGVLLQKRYRSIVCDDFISPS